MKKARNYFKKLSIGGKIWGVFLLLSALALLLILICLIGEFIDDAIYRYGEEDIIPFLIRGLLVIAGISYFFKNNKIVKWLFYFSWILAVFLFAGLLVDNNSNFWRELDRKSSGYYERQHEELIEGCKYCKSNYCDINVKRKCRSIGINLD